MKQRRSRSVCSSVLWRGSADRGVSVEQVLSDNPSAYKSYVGVRRVPISISNQSEPAPIERRDWAIPPRRTFADGWAYARF